MPRSHRQIVTTDPFVSDPFNLTSPTRGQVAPGFEERYRMHHGRYLAGLGAHQPPMHEDDLALHEPPGEPSGSDPIIRELEVTEDSASSGIFDDAGRETTAEDMGVFADHWAIPGYIARNPPFFVNPEVQDVTADADVVEVPAGGMFYIERGGRNVAPHMSPRARFDEYAWLPPVSPFHPRQPDSWAPPERPGSYRRPLPMVPPSQRAPGTTAPTAPYVPTPPPTGTMTSFGPMPSVIPQAPRPGTMVPGPAPHGTPGTGFMVPGKPHPRHAGTGLMVPGKPKKTVPHHPVALGHVPWKPPQSAVPFNHPQNVLGSRSIIEPMDGRWPITPFGQDPGATPAPATTDTGPGLGTFFVAGIVGGAAVAIFLSTVGGKK